MASNSNNILYIARDIERALGKVPKDNYYVMTNSNSYSKEIKTLYPEKIILIESNEILDTHELLNLPEVTELINKLNAEILVFKNTVQIEKICKEKGWKLLNPSAELAEKIENKISQIKWLGDLSSLLPPHKVLLTKDIKWNKEVFILQWSHGHTGDGTILIQNEANLNLIKEKFPNREARITDFIKGPMFTVNIVTTKTVTLLGNISYQITGMLPFTENTFSTIGNDWSLTHTILDENHIKQFEIIAQKIAAKMQKDGWLGLFGIDIIFDEEKNMMHLIEINARQPASTTFESKLQTILHSQGVPGISTFEAHLNALQNLPISSSLIPINDGAQILQRLTSKFSKIDFKKLIESGYNLIKYDNIKLNSDILRIQSMQGIMETHNKFNERGKKIIESLL
jgi:predicted ATP-grasp superfamily ATP-dependent carboligase